MYWGKHTTLSWQVYVIHVPVHMKIWDGFWKGKLDGNSIKQWAGDAQQSLLVSCSSWHQKIKFWHFSYLWPRIGLTLRWKRSMRQVGYRYATRYMEQWVMTFEAMDQWRGRTRIWGVPLRSWGKCTLAYSGSSRL